MLEFLSIINQLIPHTNSIFFVLIQLTCASVKNEVNFDYLQDKVDTYFEICQENIVFGEDIEDNPLNILLAQVDQLNRISSDLFLKLFPDLYKPIIRRVDLKFRDQFDFNTLISFLLLDYKLGELFNKDEVKRNAVKEEHIACFWKHFIKHCIEYKKGNVENPLSQLTFQRIPIFKRNTQLPAGEQFVPLICYKYLKQKNSKILLYAAFAYTALSNSGFLIKIVNIPDEKGLKLQNNIYKMWDKIIKQGKKNADFFKNHTVIESQGNSGFSDPDVEKGKQDYYYSTNTSSIKTRHDTLSEIKTDPKNARSFVELAGFTAWRELLEVFNEERDQISQILHLALANFCYRCKSDKFLFPLASLVCQKNLTNEDFFSNPLSIEFPLLGNRGRCCYYKRLETCEMAAKFHIDRGTFTFLCPPMVRVEENSDLTLCNESNLLITNYDDTFSRFQIKPHQWAIQGGAQLAIYSMGLLLPNPHGVNSLDVFERFQIPMFYNIDKNYLFSCTEQEKKKLLEIFNLPENVAGLTPIDLAKKFENQYIMVGDLFYRDLTTQLNISSPTKAFSKIMASSRT